MKAMARLIDADIALENIDEWLDTVGTALIGRGLSYYAELQGCIEDAPTVDAVPVVRCEDCEYAERYERLDGESGYYCGHPQSNFTYGERWDRIYKPVKDANGFCSYGERKGGGDT